MNDILPLINQILRLLTNPWRSGEHRKGVGMFESGGPRMRACPEAIDRVKDVQQEIASKLVAAMKEVAEVVSLEDQKYPDLTALGVLLKDVKELENYRRDCESALKKAPQLPAIKENKTDVANTKAYVEMRIDLGKLLVILKPMAEQDAATADPYRWTTANKHIELLMSNLHGRNLRCEEDEKALHPIMEHHVKECRSLFDKTYVETRRGVYPFDIVVGGVAKNADTIKHDRDQAKFGVDLCSLMGLIPKTREGQLLLSYGRDYEIMLWGGNIRVKYALLEISLKHGHLTMEKKQSAYKDILDALGSKPTVAGTTEQNEERSAPFDAEQEGFNTAIEEFIKKNMEHHYTLHMDKHNKLDVVVKTHEMWKKDLTAASPIDEVKLKGACLNTPLQDGSQALDTMVAARTAFEKANKDLKEAKEKCWGDHEQTMDVPNYLTKHDLLIVRAKSIKNEQHVLSVFNQESKLAPYAFRTALDLALGVLESDHVQDLVHLRSTVRTFEE